MKVSTLMRRFTLAAALLLSACAGGRPVADFPVKIGAPYRVRGTTYVPVSDPAYDMLGYASWYGSESGNRTANGEKFRPKWLTAAHPTLPLPSYVEVTALDTGRRIVVRVNDRGPFAERRRIIDLSRGAADALGLRRGAADALGLRRGGPAAVRVRVVTPAERDRARLRKGKAARDLPAEDPRILANLRAQLAAAPR